MTAWWFHLINTSHTPDLLWRSRRSLKLCEGKHAAVFAVFRTQHLFIHPAESPECRRPCTTWALLYIMYGTFHFIALFPWIQWNVLLGSLVEYAVYRMVLVESKRKSATIKATLSTGSDVFVQQTAAANIPCKNENIFYTQIEEILVSES